MQTRKQGKDWRVVTALGAIGALGFSSVALGARPDNPGEGKGIDLAEKKREIQLKVNQNTPEHVEIELGADSVESAASTASDPSESPVSPDTPDTPDSPDTPDTPDSPDTPDTPDSPASDDADDSAGS